MQDASLAVSEPPEAGQELRGLRYPLGRWTPEHGKLHAVADGVFWLRMPLPFSLNHINLWVLDDGDGWAIVDTGIAAPGCKDLWRALFAGPMAGRPVSRVIVTHYHPDHLGLAGWLTHKWGVPLEISRGEFMLARVLTLDVADAPPQAAVDFYSRAGWDDEAVARFRGQSWGRFGRAVTRLPVGFTRLVDGQSLTIGGRAWRVVTGSGHSPEHVCLVCDEAGVIISGDQLLPRITSNVSVYPTEPGADPLGEWFASLDKLDRLDPELLVLPAHNEPFQRLHVRTEQLRADHLRKLDALEAQLARAPCSAVDCFQTLFARPIRADDLMMATGEALAHLHWLERQGRAVRLRDDGVDRFARS
jgi:glyoxylase-like metal-dependent hydrolase (beta-lactamase superfamily II)